jgi:TIR domain
MTDLQIVIVHDNNPADTAWSKRLQSALDRDFGKRPLLDENKPTVRRVAGYQKLPAPKTLGALSLVLLVLPAEGCEFTDDHRKRIEEFCKSPTVGGDRIIPVPSERSHKGRPPAPLDTIVAADFVDPANAAAVAVFATGVLNKLCLRVPSEHRSVFVSYRQKHGQFWSEKIAAGLVQRGYKVWRDFNRDSDDQKLIRAGSKAQETIHKAIREHAFVLVIDTPGAHLSTWVDEEVQSAIKYARPVLPVVIESPEGGDSGEIPVPPKKGGRFRALSDEQVEVRITNADQIAAGGGLSALDAAFFNRLETAMADRLLGLLRTQRRLIQAAREQLTGSRFDWSPVVEEQLLFNAVYRCDSNDFPRLALRFLVQCVPYGTVMDSTITNLAAQWAKQKLPHQYCLIVHQTGISPAEKGRLLEHSGGHVIVMQPDELPRIQRIFSIA